MRFGLIPSQCLKRSRVGAYAVGCFLLCADWAGAESVTCVGTSLPNAELLYQKDTFELKETSTATISVRRCSPMPNSYAARRYGELS
jgi:hypothetical protein